VTAGEPVWRALYPPGMPTEIAPDVPGVLARFRATVRAAGDAPCLHYFGATLTRQEVDDASDALAVALVQRGVGPGERVAISLQSTPAFVLTALAAWKLGAIVVPVNPMYRVRELAHVLQDSGACVLVADPGLRETIEALPAAATPHQVLYSAGHELAGDATGPWPDGETAPSPRWVDALAEGRGARPPDPPSPATEIAMLTYTSGTTGPAKAAMNTHANLAYEIEAGRRWLSLGDDDVIFAAAPLFHITGFTLHMVLALGTGVPVVLAHRFSVASCLALFERYRPTFTVAATTVFVALLAEGATAWERLRPLRKVLSGGAPVPATVVETYERDVGPYIHNAYGLTETTSATILVPLGRRAPVDPASGALSIGVPLPGVAVRILGDDGAELPSGETGEIAVRGPQVSAGYWNNPVETAAAFPGGELRTGDVGFMDEQGWVYIVDRKKDLIVASGYKVWPREVEDVLYEHPAVREAAVVGAPDDYRGETVHAFVSLNGGERTSGDELRAFCRQRLAAYKCPSRIEVLEDLPKTPTGKILRRDLRGDGA
jgi:long-chain acyl-CoA synthetase